jgi:putative sigma-54 modulation protein
MEASTVNSAVGNSVKSAQQEILKMKIHVLDRNVGMTSEQRVKIERSLQFAFDRFLNVRAVDVLFSDVNGPKGGEDLHCRMKISLQGKGDLVVEGKGSAVEAVAADTADRAAMAVSRRLDKLRDVQGTSMSGQ